MEADEITEGMRLALAHHWWVWDHAWIQSALEMSITWRFVQLVNETDSDGRLSETYRTARQALESLGRGDRAIGKILAGTTFPKLGFLVGGPHILGAVPQALLPTSIERWVAEATVYLVTRERQQEYVGADKPHKLNELDAFIIASSEPEAPRMPETLRYARAVVSLPPRAATVTTPILNRDLALWLRTQDKDVCTVAVRLGSVLEQCDAVLKAESDQQAAAARRRGGTKMRRNETPEG